MAATNPKEYSSLPLILAITAAIVVSVLGGWFALGTESLAEDATIVSNAPVQSSNPADDDQIDIDAELRKARLSTAAELLVAPPRQNALYYYGRVLAADSKHPIAIAELDALLAAILRTVNNHLSLEEFDDAYDLALAAARHRPDHPLVQQMQGDLNEFAAALADEASLLAQNGNDDEATAKLETLKGLPGLSADYVAAAEQLVAETQASRAEQESIEQQARLEEEAKLEWQQKIEAAIAADNLIAPEGDNARDFLAERDDPAELKEQLSEQLRDALLVSAREKISTGDLDQLEAYLAAGLELGASEDTIATLQADFDSKLLEQESTKSIALSEFVRLTSAEPKYPIRASQRDITGWVEVAFTVTKSGETADIQVVRAEPEKIFETSAIQAVKKWTFEPREFQGAAIDQRTTARLVFDFAE